jgi:hypothetical protein
MNSDRRRHRYQHPFVFQHADPPGGEAGSTCEFVICFHIRKQGSGLSGAMVHRVVVAGAESLGPSIAEMEVKYTAGPNCSIFTALLICAAVDLVDRSRSPCELSDGRTRFRLIAFDLGLSCWQAVVEPVQATELEAADRLWGRRSLFDSF